VSALPELRLGTRGSQLALWQARAVAAAVAASGGPPCRLVTIKTSGDHLQSAPLSAAGGKRLFVKEIEDALLRGDIDLAVHSSKDMPARLPAGLVIAGVLPREDPRDALVLRDADGLADDGPLLKVEEVVSRLGDAPSIGTGSVRRIAQLKPLFPRSRFAPIRGNLDTRLRKLDAGDYDALVLAAAGLRRLGFAARVSCALPTHACLPAPGQGIVAIETREDDEPVRAIVAAVHDAAAGAELAAERAVVDALGAGCQTPVAALGACTGEGELEIVAAVFALDGSRAVRAEARGARHDAVSLGALVGASLIADGAAALLNEAQCRPGPEEFRSAALSDE
jgi:hydroxymethylbilane synthase